MSLREEQFPEFTALEHRIRNTNINYETLAEAATRAVSQIERTFNAQVLSRSGFVFQEISDLHYQVINEIFERSALVEDQECMNLVRVHLDDAVELAGNSSSPDYRDIVSRLGFMQILEVYPTLSQIHWATPHYTMAPMTLFGSHNAVTSFDEVLQILDLDVFTHERQFEGLVDQILRELIVFENYLTRQLLPVIFLSLQGTQNHFNTYVEDLRGNMLACV